MTDPTEIIISYEDRLRLSELAGELVHAQWLADNPLIANSLPCLIALVGGLILAWLLNNTVLEDLEWKWSLAIDKSIERYVLLNKFMHAIVWVMPFILTVLVWFLFQAFRAHDVDVIQAEIDEIHRIWGMK